MKWFCVYDDGDEKFTRLAVCGEDGNVINEMSNELAISIFYKLIFETLHTITTIRYKVL